MIPTKTIRTAIRRAFVVIGVLVLAFYLIRIVGRYREFHHELTVFNNVQLNNLQADVLYRLGTPTNVLSPIERNDWGEWQTVYTVEGPAGDPTTKPLNTRIEDYNDWAYERANGSSRLEVKFETTGLVKSLGWYCNSDCLDSPGWGPIAGIRSGDSEEKILSLGKPSRNSIEHTTKTIEFDDIGLRFLLTKGRVYGVTRIHPKKGEGAIVWRFLHTLP